MAARASVVRQRVFSRASVVADGSAHHLAAQCLPATFRPTILPPHARPVGSRHLLYTAYTRDMRPPIHWVFTHVVHLLRQLFLLVCGDTFGFPARLFAPTRTR
jgi:hypothetical protein